MTDTAVKAELPYDCRLNRFLTDDDLPGDLTAADFARFLRLSHARLHSLDSLVDGEWVRDPATFRFGDQSEFPVRGRNGTFASVVAGLAEIARAESQPPALTEAVAWRFHDGAVKGPADGSGELFDFITADGREYRAQKQPNFWHLVSLWRPHVPAPSTIQTGGEGVREAVRKHVWEAVLSASVEVPDDFAKRVEMRETITANTVDSILEALSPRSGGLGSTTGARAPSVPTEGHGAPVVSGRAAISSADLIANTDYAKGAIDDRGGGRGA